jgi:hypothetical protein
MSNEDEKISIALTYAQTQTLISKAREESLAWKALMAAVPDFRIVDGTKVPPFAVMVLCDAVSAAALKELALVHCPGAVAAIELGIQEGLERARKNSQP